MHLTGKSHKNEEHIKKAIVSGYDRGVCDKNGNTLPKSKQGNNGKGDRRRIYSQAYDDGYERIFGPAKLNIGFVKE